MLAAKEAVPLKLIEEFSALLEKKTGLYFPRDRYRELESKLLPLTSSAGFQNAAQGISWLLECLQHNEQTSELAYHLTIGETYFFRDAKLFSILEHEILPQLIASHAHDKTLRIWSAGCCTGEEPYSIAILLDRLLPNRETWNIHLFGTDLNPKFLRKAVEGRFTRWSFRTTPENIVDQYFVAIDRHTHQIIPEIRRMVTFSTHNLVTEGSVEDNSRMSHQDLILCNNVLIYFSRNQIERTINSFAAALSNKGWLVVTPIEAPFVQHPQLVHRQLNSYLLFQKETSHHYVEPFCTTNKKTSFTTPTSLPPPSNGHDEMLLRVVLPAFLKTATPVLEYRFSATTSHKPLPVEQPTRTENTLEHAKALCQRKRYDDATTALLDALEPHQNDLKRIKESQQLVHLLIRLLANQDKLSQALTWCDKALAADKLDPILYYLRAEIESAQGKTSAAITSLKHSIFLQDDFIAAHYLLGLLSQQQQQHAIAAKQFTLVLELLKRHQDDDVLPGTEELTAKQIRASFTFSDRISARRGVSDTAADDEGIASAIAEETAAVDETTAAGRKLTQKVNKAQIRDHLCDEPKEQR